MMDNVKLTPWFPGTVKPVRPGVYETAYRGIRWFRKWDGNRWYVGDETPSVAWKEKSRTAVTGFPWRGLAEEPK
jgi:hypothetical protein